MNKREKEVFGGLLDREDLVLKELKRQYERALRDINDKIKLLQSDELTQSRIYQVNYQKALKGQVEAILEKLHGDEYSTVQKYLSDSYTDAYVGTMYAMSGHGVHVITPIDQKAAVKAIVTDSELKTDLYAALGYDMTTLKKHIRQEITRGIATSLPYEQIARNIANFTDLPLSNAKRIVRTEGHRIQQASADDARNVAKLKGADVVKQWDASLDGATRPLHRELDGQIREVDEPFEAGGRKVMYPGKFGTPDQDCNCRCVALTRARWALDEKELEILKERAAYFGLDKTESFEDYKKKYLKAAEEQEIKMHSVEDVNTKATNALLEAYDERRKHFGLRAATADELRKLEHNPFTANYTGLSVQTADAFNDTITELSKEYYSGFTKIEVADPKKMLGVTSFATTKHNNLVGQKTLEINPIKTKDYDKLVERVEELSRKGHAVEIAAGNSGKYIATHEFAHSLMDMESSLKNYVNMDTKPIQKARKEIKAIYDRYIKEVTPLEKASKSLESKFLLTNDLEEMATLQAEYLSAKKELKLVKISKYSMESADEFMAEAFTQAKIGVSESPYTSEVMRVIDKLFKKNAD